MRIQIVVGVLAVGVAVFLLRDFLFQGRNFDERKEYWESEISNSIIMGSSSSEELSSFANNHGQKLHCYQNYNREDKCDFNDSESIVGTSSRPMKLAVIFAIKEKKIVSYQFVPTAAIGFE